MVPQLEVSPNAAQRIQNHDCWVFRDELLTPSAPLPNGEVVELIDQHHTFLAYAFYSPSSHVAARVVSTNQNQPVDRTLLLERLTRAIRARAKILHTNAKRLVFSEADGLPGLIVDQYGDYLVLQSRTGGIERWKPTLVDGLRKLVQPKGMLERSDKEFRDTEGLPPLIQLLSGTVPEHIRIEEDGITFVVDPYHGQKTGFYLDQRETRRAVRALVQPGERVADVFAYTGAFGIGAATRGAEVLCVEQQDACIAWAKEHATLNGVEHRMTYVVGDAFAWLAAKANRRDQFDWVFLDPPALAKSKAERLSGRQALHHLLVHALDLLVPGGTLVLSVCTYHLLGLTEEILRIAAASRGVQVVIRATTLQAPDHPWVLQRPMTRYLMGWIAQCDGPPAA